MGCSFIVIYFLLSLRYVVMFASLTSVRLGLRRHSHFTFSSELHGRLGGVATFLWLVADFLSPPFLKRFQF